MGVRNYLIEGVRHRCPELFASASESTLAAA
jgi:hypothetical protein